MGTLLLSVALLGGEPGLSLEAGRFPAAFGDRRKLPWFADLRLGAVGSGDSEGASVAAGVQLGFFPIEELALSWSLHYHELDYLDERVRVNTYAWEVGVLYYPIREGRGWPYLLAGGSINDTALDYSGAANPLEDETQGLFGAHLGAGLEIRPVPGADGLSFTVEARYGWVEERGTRLGAMDGEEMDTWQVTGSVMIRSPSPGVSLLFYLAMAVLVATSGL